MIGETVSKLRFSLKQKVYHMYNPVKFVAINISKHSIELCPPYKNNKLSRKLISSKFSE